MARRLSAVSLLLFVCFLLVASAQRGAIVKPLSLDQLTSQADRIVHGHVVSARVEPHPKYKNLSTVVVTVRVTDTLKGSSANQLTFRQFIWDLRDKRDTASYKKGQELVLFLNKVNAEGFTSPAGLEQGRMEVEREANGRAVIRANAPNAILLRGVESALAKRSKAMAPSVRAAQQDQSHKIELTDFKRTVRDLVDTRGGK